VERDRAFTRETGSIHHEIAAGELTGIARLESLPREKALLEPVSWARGSRVDLFLTKLVRITDSH
jgi:hypothetical protein